MVVLVLGASGMLGHKLTQVLSHRFAVVGTVRGSASEYAGHPVLGQVCLRGNVQVEHFDSVVGELAEVKPEAVINCIGIVKQLPAAQDPLLSIAVNAFFPHRLAKLCQAAGVRLIHISTDCVFSGNRGNYTEDDVADAQDLYGRTKFLGEVTGQGCLTLRTSIIGRELHTNHGLIEWFIGQKGDVVQGYARAIYSGLTTLALAELIGNILEQHPNLSGLRHVSSAPISKYELLRLVNRAFELGTTINRDTKFVCDRSLDSTCFREVTGYHPPSWPEMIAKMVVDPTPYDEMRKAKDAD